MAILHLNTSPAPPGAGDACVRKRFLQQTCQACAHACPVQAISVSGNAVFVDSDTCVRCGNCLFVCPVDALENLQPALRHYREERLVAPFSSPPPLKEELLMWHVQYGIRAVELDMDEHPAWALAVAALNVQLAQLNAPRWQILPPAPKTVNVLRRRLLRAKETAVASARVEPSHHLRRAAFATISEYRLTLDKTLCIACGACERVCGEKAITFNDDTLTLLPARCTGCRNCAVVCPVKALTVEAHSEAARTAQFHYAQKTCTDCQREFLTFNPGDKRCPLCQHHQHGMRGL